MEILFDLNCTYQRGWPDVPVDNRQWTVLRGTDEDVSMIRSKPGKDNVWETIKSVPASEVLELAVDVIQTEDQLRIRPNVTGVLLVTRSGDHVLFRVQQMAPIEVRAVIGPWCARFLAENAKKPTTPG
jgi:hypothetical protein